MTAYDDYMNHTGPPAPTQEEQRLYAEKLKTWTNEQLNQTYRTCNSRTHQDLILRELHHRMNAHQ